MELNIEKLVSDIIGKTHKALGFPVDSNEQGKSSFHRKSIRRLIDGKEYVIGDVLNLKKTSLPTNSRLTENQREILANHLETLFNVHNLAPVFPKNFPYHKRYQFLRDLLGQSFEYMAGSICNIEFCNHDFSECPFEGFCNICTDHIKSDKQTTSEAASYHNDEFILEEFIEPQADIAKKFSVNLSVN